MQPEPTPTLFDPDHDTPHGLPRGLRSDVTSAYQRVIVNPLLAILGWLLAIVLIRYSTRLHNLALYLTAILWLFVPFVLIQFHCLDCRVTGWLLRSAPPRLPFRGRPLGQQREPARPVALDHGPDSLLDLRPCRLGNPGFRRVQGHAVRWAGRSGSDRNQVTGRSGYRTTGDTEKTRDGFQEVNPET